MHIWHIPHFAQQPEVVVAEGEDEEELDEDDDSVSASADADVKFVFPENANLGSLLRVCCVRACRSTPLQSFPLAPSFPSSLASTTRASLLLLCRALRDPSDTCKTTASSSRTYAFKFTVSALAYPCLCFFIIIVHCRRD